MKKRNALILKIGLGVVAAMSVVALIVLNSFLPHNRLRESPEVTFRRLIADAVPPSVRDIKVEGDDTQYASQVTMRFMIDPKEFPRLLNKRAYTQKSPATEGWVEYSASENGGSKTYDLSINEKERVAFFNYWAS